MAIGSGSAIDVEVRELDARLTERDDAVGKLSDLQRENDELVARFLELKAQQAAVTAAEKAAFNAKKDANALRARATATGDYKLLNKAKGEQKKAEGLSKKAKDEAKKLTQVRAKAAVQRTKDREALGKKIAAERMVTREKCLLERFMSFLI